MGLQRLNNHGVVLLGCGKMGTALLSRWLNNGLEPRSAFVIEPTPSDWLVARGVALNTHPPDAPAAVIVAVKPQSLKEALPTLRKFSKDTLIVSIAAGITLETYASVLSGVPIIRAMPNTPAMIGQGITALIGNQNVGQKDRDIAYSLLAAVGQVLWLTDEAQMDAVTGLSGSGPAYVFYMIECLAHAGEAEGLPPDMALQLAQATVAGAGALAAMSDEPTSDLRHNVTSPGGTTQAGLAVLMEERAGLLPLITRTVAAAAARSAALKKG